MMENRVLGSADLRGMLLPVGSFEILPADAYQLTDAAAKIMFTIIASPITTPSEICWNQTMATIPITTAKTTPFNRPTCSSFFTIRLAL